MRRLSALSLLSIAALYLSSCATLPPASPPGPAGWLELLPPESTVFAAAEVSVVRELAAAAVERGLPGVPAGQASGEQLEAVLDRTRRLYGALHLVPGTRPSFSVVALGEFNPGLVACRLAAGRDWQRHRLKKAREAGGVAAGAQGRTYWEHRSLALELAAPRPGLVLLSNGGMARMLHRFQQSAAGSPAGSLELPGEALAAMQGATLFAYLPTVPASAGPAPAGTAPAGTAPAGPAPAGTAPAPIRDLWLAATEDPAAQGVYLAEAVFRLEEEKSPRLLVSLFRLLLAAWLRGSGLDDPVGRLKGATIEAEGNVVRLTGLRVSGAEILQLLGGFLPPPE